MTADDATPPLVAAPPVPPVVPDSEALADQIPASMPQDGLHWYRRWLVAQQQLDAKFQREVSSGSGVVPDKPALAPETSWTERFANDVQAALQEEHRPRWVNGKPCSDHRADDCCYDCCTTCYLLEVLADREPNASVPAVTDDEAATNALAVALHDPDECRQCMVRKAGGHCVAWNGALLRAASIIAGLRSAGFLIVHHTKET